MRNTRQINTTKKKVKAIETRQMVDGLAGPAASTAHTAENVILGTTSKAKNALNLNLLKVGPIVATVLGGAFTVLTILSVIAIVVIVVISSTPLPPKPNPDYITTFKTIPTPIYVLKNG